MAMAPAMRELPFRVCSTRCSAWPSAGLPGLSRQSRKAAPTEGTSSWASSRKICNNSGSRSSSSRRQRRLDDDLDPELLQIFLDEAHELVPSVGAALRDWRDNPGNPALGQALQRVLHTLKGSSRMAGAMAMGELTHHMEARVENAMSVKTLPAALFEELETSWDRMGFLFEELQKPRVLQENLAAAVAAPKGPEAAAIEEPEAPPEPAPLAAAPAAAAKAVPLAERELQPKALLRVRADVVDRLVNQAGASAHAARRDPRAIRAPAGGPSAASRNGSTASCASPRRKSASAPIWTSRAPRSSSTARCSSASPDRSSTCCATP